MFIREGVDLIAFRTSSPETLGSDRSKKIRSGAGTPADFPSPLTYIRASSPSVTHRRPLVSPASLKASTVRRVSEALLFTTSISIPLFTGGIDKTGTETLDMPTTFLIATKLGTP